MLYFGELITQSNGTEIEIIHVHYEIEIIGNHGKVKVIHTIKNTSNEDCNVTISLQLDDESVVTGYSFINKNGEFISQLKEKKQAKREQKESTLNGYSSAVMEKQDDLTFNISLGIVVKHSEVSFSIEYLTRFDIEDDHLIMKIPQITQKENEIPFSLTIKETNVTFKGMIKEEQEIEIPIPKEMMISMKDEETDEIVISSTFINTENKGDCKVIFLCDRSGSMNGDGIQSLKEMLQLFLRQLPMNCEFQIISYGNRFECMFEKMMKYNDEVLKKASENVKEFQANFGGTEMVYPLQQLIQDKIENTHIICLTDGEDFEKERCLTAMKELATKNTIHGVGLGRECDVDFIRRAGRIGNGISVISKDMKKLRQEVSKITQRILIPSINNCEIKWNIEGELTPSVINNFNGITTCFISCENELKEHQEIECELKGECEGNEKRMKNTSTYKEQKGLLIHQLMAFQQIKKLESENKTEEATKLSLKYNVLCKSTAFIAIDKTTKNEIDFIKNVKVEDIHRDTFNGILYSPPMPPYANFIPNNGILYSPPMPSCPNAMPTCGASWGFISPSYDAGDGDGCDYEDDICLEFEKCEECEECEEFDPIPQNLCMECFEPIEPQMNINSDMIMPKKFDEFINHQIQPVQMDSITMEMNEKDENDEESKKGKRIDVVDDLDELLCEIESKYEMKKEKEMKIEPLQSREVKLNKNQVFDEIVLHQKANGEFDDISNVLKEVNELKNKQLSFSILQTYFIVEVLKQHFKERKGEWKLLVKKSEQWLSSQQEIPQEMKDEIMNIIKKMIF